MGSDMNKSKLLLVAAALALAAPGSASAASLDGTWSGGGFVKPSSGNSEKVRCRVSYDRQTDKVFGVTATCATPSNKIYQTGTVLKVSEDRYVGDFYNGQFDISGRVRVTVQGSRQTVTFSSAKGTGKMELRRR